MLDSIYHTAQLLISLLYIAILQVLRNMSSTECTISVHMEQGQNVHFGHMVCIGLSGTTNSFYNGKYTPSHY